MLALTFFAKYIVHACVFIGSNKIFAHEIDQSQFIYVVHHACTHIFRRRNRPIPVHRRCSQCLHSHFSQSRQDLRAFSLVRTTFSHMKSTNPSSSSLFTMLALTFFAKSKSHVCVFIGSYKIFAHENDQSQFDVVHHVLIMFPLPTFCKVHIFLSLSLVSHIIPTKRSPRHACRHAWPLACPAARVETVLHEKKSAYEGK